MSQVLYSPAAEKDLLGIVEYIALDKPQAARIWLQKIRDTCETLANHSEIGEARPEFGVPGCRSLSVGNYVILFRAMEGGIEVSRIFHGSRDIRHL